MEFGNPWGRIGIETGKLWEEWLEEHAIVKRKFCKSTERVK